MQNQAEKQKPCYRYNIQDDNTAIHYLHMIAEHWYATGTQTGIVHKLPSSLLFKTGMAIIYSVV
jgi:hypothetical protein